MRTMRTKLSGLSAGCKPSTAVRAVAGHRRDALRAGFELRRVWVMSADATYVVCRREEATVALAVDALSMSSEGPVSQHVRSSPEQLLTDLEYVQQLMALRPPDGGRQLGAMHRRSRGRGPPSDIASVWRSCAGGITGRTRHNTYAVIAPMICNWTGPTTPLSEP